MKVSTRTRYGLRLMLGLALASGRGPVMLREIAQKEAISEKYLSQIIIPLRTSGLVNSYRGAHGGYVLAKEPSRITVRQIVEVLEGGIQLINADNSAGEREQVSIKVTHDIWKQASKKLAATLESITLRDLVERYQEKKYKKTAMYNI